MKTQFFYNSTLILILLCGNVLFAFSTRHLPERKPKKETSKKTTAVASAITATGDQVYCPQSTIKIVTDVAINATEEINAIYIQISSGYEINEDVLTLIGTHPNLTSNWNPDSGTLVISNIAGKTASLSEFIATIKAVEFKNSSLDPKGIRNFSISLGQANYLPSSKHYYQFVSSPGISWGEAKRAAADEQLFWIKRLFSNYYYFRRSNICWRTTFRNRMDWWKRC
ncbi:hypothetical protein ACQ9BO_06595 [Flavobacterium sp. P21]|uniref:hypothetical protein n=1 Tax=Flavobacterium sp. P21 TaxID=3423948 RepID=UPI003D6768C3